MNTGDVISYNEMCMTEGFSLQRGMNFRVNGRVSIILMSLRKGSPYADRVEEGGAVLIYEGHDVPKNFAKFPKLVNQPMTNPGGALTQNGKFFEAAEKFKRGESDAELVKVYEKIKDGIWVYNGMFQLLDSWQERAGRRKVFKFKLTITNEPLAVKKRKKVLIDDLTHNRMIPSTVKLAVWKRDKGCCRQCGSTNNLHFDHILPFSKGGTSIKPENIQLLCARHNLQKRDKIQ